MEGGVAKSSSQSVEVIHGVEMPLRPQGGWTQIKRVNLFSTQHGVWYMEAAQQTLVVQRS